MGDLSEHEVKDRADKTGWVLALLAYAGMNAGLYFLLKELRLLAVHGEILLSISWLPTGALAFWLKGRFEDWLIHGR